MPAPSEPSWWSVRAWITPPDLDAGSRSAWDQEVAAIARQAGIDDWSGEGLEDFLAEYVVARQGAQPDADVGWFGRHQGAYGLAYSVQATSEADALAQAAARLGLAEGWTTSFEVGPATR